MDSPSWCVTFLVKTSGCLDLYVDPNIDTLESVQWLGETRVHRSEPLIPTTIVPTRTLRVGPRVVYHWTRLYP